MTDARHKVQGTRERGVARSAGSSFCGCFAIIAITGLTGTVFAQAGNDPTRPPPGLGAGATDADVEGVPGGGMTLQSVMISPTQKAAIISGVMVKLGDKYGDAVLVKVSENEVVLKSGETQQVLKLYPGVDKREILPVAEKSTQRRGKARASAAPAAVDSAHRHARRVVTQLLDTGGRSGVGRGRRHGARQDSCQRAGWHGS